MSSVLKLSRSAEEGLRELLKFLLEKERVKAVFTLRKINKNGTVSYSIITDANMLKDALPLFPLMPQNAGKLLSRLTLKEHLAEPIAAVLRPCELRAFIELVKREQGSLENIIFISTTCPGTFPLEMSVNGDISKKLPEYEEDVKKGNIISDIRPICKACEYFMPYSADMTVALIGKKDIDKNCEIFLNTEKAEKLIEGMDGELVERELETEEVKNLRSKRQEEKRKLFEEINVEGLGLSGLVETFGRCIGCHGCSRVCPICYCVLCDFESRDYENEPSTYESELKKRGGVRVPPNTVLYHLGRLTHVSVSCVGCGMCTDVCPADIPLSTIFLKVGEEVQKIFNYIPGKDVEEAIPLNKFEKDEFTEVED
ncbi:Coenzyme F420 hydrogenase/dehydrogenase, beta subunit C-terminal domain [candidate division WOR-3 bacterium]|nr:Coenzyme F420 hydrogenase/dehydrogenase, beta subunit C-terminal domain [candidate division WOR-3 bacterium]